MNDTCGARNKHLTGHTEVTIIYQLGHCLIIKKSVIIVSKALKALNAKFLYKNLITYFKSWEAFLYENTILIVLAGLKTLTFYTRNRVSRIPHLRNTVINWKEWGTWSWTKLRKQKDCREPHKTRGLRKIRRNLIQDSYPCEHDVWNLALQCQRAAYTMVKKINNLPVRASSVLTSAFLLACFSKRSSNTIASSILK